jgi:hypothetical protein
MGSCMLSDFGIDMSEFEEMCFLPSEGCTFLRHLAPCYHLVVYDFPSSSLQTE